MNQIRKVASGALLAGAVAACAAVAAPPAAAVVDGERVASGDAPWAVSLRGQPVRTLPMAHACSATVIGPRRVLTARHCVEHAYMWRAEVMVGSDDPDRRPGRAVPVARTWVAGLYDWSGPGTDAAGGDIAVIETARDIPAPAVPLTAAGTVLAKDEPVWPYGFGHTDFAQSKLKEPALLRRAAMVAHTVAECAESDFGNDPTWLCASRSAGPGGGIVAPGDSGGGVMRQVPGGGLEQVGVVSAGTRGTLAATTSGFTSVAATHAFVTQPERGVELPRPRGRSRLKGTARVGARVRCEAGFTPVVRRVVIRWSATRRGARALSYRSGADGLKLPAATAGRQLSCMAEGQLRFEEYGAVADPSRPVEVKR